MLSRISTNPFTGDSPRGLFNETLCRLTSHSLSKIYSSDSQRQIVFLGKGSGIPKKQMDHMREFRSKCYLHLSPWLLNESPAQENFTDRMSYHLVALKRNRIYGAIRLTPFPFSFHRLSNFSSELIEGKENFLELNTQATLKKDPKLEKMILMMAAIHSFKKINCDGLISIIPSSNSENFKKIGMEKIGEDFFIPEHENISHSILSTTFADLFANPLRLL